MEVHNFVLKQRQKTFTSMIYVMIKWDINTYAVTVLYIIFLISLG